MDIVNAISQAIVKRLQGAGKISFLGLMMSFFSFRYLESCLHGCIIASKMLFLSESVRDAIDIKLSKKYNAPVNILGMILICFCNIMNVFLNF